MHKAVFEQFLSGFDKIYERRDMEVVSFRKDRVSGVQV
jgi:hypothetical protein